MSNHTPGPWEVTNAYPEANARICISGHTLLKVVPVGEEKAVAICGREELEEVQANAKLIAAAPDLLAALQDMVSDHKELSEATIDFARKALAKATSK